jgi:hypothetical protein
MSAEPVGLLPWAPPNGILIALGSCVSYDMLA